MISRKRPVKQKPKVVRDVESGFIGVGTFLNNMKRCAVSQRARYEDDNVEGCQCCVSVQGTV